MRLSVMFARRVRRSVVSLTRLACVIALVGLATFAVSMLYPRPLVVIFSMSIGHAIGAAAFLVYLLAVLLDTVRRSPEATVEVSPTPATSAEDESPEASDGSVGERLPAAGRRHSRPKQ